MPEEGIPTPQNEQPAATTQPGKGAEERIVELERLVRGMEDFVAKKDEEIAGLKKKLTAAEALKDPKNVKRLIELAFVDQLTGVFNRNGLEQEAVKSITHQIERLRDLKRAASGGEQRQEARSEEFLSVIMMDIDHFKKINDTYGHSTGDVVLRKVGEAIRNSIRGDDYAGRWGGEEFVLCITSPNERVRRTVAERLRKAISEMDAVDTDGNRIPDLAASFGIADWEPGEVLEDTVKRADAALYEAKHAGRNQVVTEIRTRAEGGMKTSYLTRYSEEPIPKEDIKEFLKKKSAKETKVGRKTPALQRAGGSSSSSP